MPAIIAVFQIGPFAIEYPDRILALLVGFVLIVLLLWKVNVPLFSYPYVSGVLKERAERIARNHAQVERALTEVRQLRDDYAARLRSIEEETRQRIDAAVREAEAVREEIIAEAQETARLLRRRAEEELERERTRQRILLRRQIVQTIVDAAEHSVIAQSNDRMQRELIRDFIRKASSKSPGAVGAVPPTSPAPREEEV